MRKIALTLTAAFLFGACADTTEKKETAKPVLPVYNGVLVIGSDYQSVSLSNLNAGTGILANKAFLKSGSTKPGLTTTLSKDVSIPSTPTPSGDMVIIDREYSVITWINPADLKVRRQVKVGEPSYGANPHDYVELSAKKGYVARYGVVLDGDNIVEGDDILVINPETGAHLGRIDLHDLATPATTGTTFANPDSLIQVGKFVYATLQNFTADYLAGQARIAIINTANDKVSGHLDLPGIKNCGNLVHDPVEKQVFVACSGAFSDGPEGQLAGSAIIVLDASTPQSPTIARTVKAAELGNTSFQFELGLLSKGRVLVATFGDFEGKGDKAFILDMNNEGEDPIEVHTTDAYSLSLFADAANQRFYLGDAKFDAPALHVFAYDTATTAFTKESTIKFEGDELPPRSIAGY